MFKSLRLVTLAVVAVGPLVLAACDNGPAQRAGKDIDRATGQDGLLTKGPVEKAGKDVDRTLGTNR